jgi:hypothetical protein
MNKWTISIFIVLVSIWVPVWAVKVNTLFEVDVSVASQAPDARAEAIREGFHDVLIKLAGNQNVIKNKVLRSSLDKSDYYVQEYSYSAPTVSSATYNLHIKYSEQDVRRLLRKASVTAWGDNRPLLLVWLAMVNDKHDVEILGGENGNDVVGKVKRFGQRFGVPLIFPVMDMTDMQKISSDNVTSISVQELKDASKRYEPEALLIGTLEHDGDIYSGHWSLVWGDKAWDWNLEADSREKVLSDVMDNVSQVLSRRADIKPKAELSQN